MKNSLGILGGGQLGMFICQAAKKYNIKTTVFSDSKNFSAKEFCDNFLIKSHIGNQPVFYLFIPFTPLNLIGDIPTI